MHIRPALESDFTAMWPIFQQVVEPGTTYVFASNTSCEDAFAYWFASGVTSYVAEDDGQVVGMYKLVANASFMVNPGYSGKGVGKEMGLHCLCEARKAGYLAMQFNFVVSTNEAAVSLWQKLGFSIVGTLPRAFLHKKLGYVDAYVMYRVLDDTNLTDHRRPCRTGSSRSIF